MEPWCEGVGQGGERVRYKEEKMSKYEEIEAKVGKLVDEKQAAYGDSFGNAHKVL